MVKTKIDGVWWYAQSWWVLRWRLLVRVGKLLTAAIRGDK